METLPLDMKRIVLHFVDPESHPDLALTSKCWYELALDRASREMKKITLFEMGDVCDEILEEICLRKDILLLHYLLKKITNYSLYKVALYSGQSGSLSLWRYIHKITTTELNEIQDAVQKYNARHPNEELNTVDLDERKQIILHDGLHGASMKGHAILVKKLLEMGADVDTAILTDVSKFNHLPVLILLFDRLGEYHYTYYESAYYAACRHDRVEIVKYIMDHTILGSMSTTRHFFEGDDIITQRRRSLLMGERFSKKNNSVHVLQYIEEELNKLSPCPPPPPSTAGSPAALFFPGTEDTYPRYTVYTQYNQSGEFS